MTEPKDQQRKNACPRDCHELHETPTITLHIPNYIRFLILIQQEVLRMHQLCIIDEPHSGISIALLGYQALSATLVSKPD